MARVQKLKHAYSTSSSVADVEIATDPFEFYRYLRKEEPVRKDPELGYYWITPRDMVMRAFMDPQRFSSVTDFQFRKHYRPRAQKVWDEAGFEMAPTVLNSDAPLHGQLRRYVSTLLTPSRVNSLTSNIEKISDELISGFMADGHADFATQFAGLLPATVLADLLGIAREDRAKFKAWADCVPALQTPRLSEDDEVELVKRVVEMVHYLKTHLENAKSPADGMVMYDIATLNRDDGTPFSFAERTWMAILFFIAGVETTANTLVSAIDFLCYHPPLQDELRNDPDKVGKFVEEILRLRGPVRANVRRAAKDFEFGGHKIREGEDIMLCTAAANRDEGYWEQADAFKLDRPNSRAHLSFGAGPHICAGAHLARVELNIAMKSILRSLKNIRHADPTNLPQSQPLALFNNIPTLPIVFDR